RCRIQPEDEDVNEIHSGPRVRNFRLNLRRAAHMPARKNTLKDHLSRYSDINISVIGRKSGRTIKIPVWFVLDDENLYLLPVQGSDTQWYKNRSEERRVGKE